MKNSFFAGLLSLTVMISCQPDKQLTNYVNPLLGTATLWETKDLGYERHLKTRTWGAEVFPGSSVPNAMVQLSPVTQFRSGAGYQYEIRSSMVSRIPTKDIGICCISLSFR